MDTHPGAASVAGQLLAFYREPALHRPPYIHGEAPLPDGQVVLRLALGRFPPGWLRDLPQRDREEVRDAAVAFVRQVCLWERATHYQVLCLEPDATHEAIRESYRLLIALIHPDRQDAAGPGWPTGCSQRANQAHEVLADAQARAEYDAGLRRTGGAAAVEAAVRASHVTGQGAGRRSRRVRSSPASLAKRFVVVSGVIAALFIVQAWWVGDVAPHYSLLERAIPASSRWVRDILPDPPRFLATAETPFKPELLESLNEPRRIAAVGAWVPLQDPPSEAAAKAPDLPVSAAAAAPQEPARAPQAMPAPPASMVAPEPAAPVLRLAQAPTAPPAPATPAAPVSTGPTRDQIESLVAQLVGYYDAGDADRLVGLYDPGELGWFGGGRIRTPFADFFGATRERRLRMERLQWRNAGSSAQARGEATVLADYVDGRPRLERRVPVELDIALRDGQARITRLVLFPGGQ